MSTSIIPDRTEVGNYFVANYPPFSVWTKDAVEKEARPALATLPRRGPEAPGVNRGAGPPGSIDEVPLGLYLHIPFCRKRCHFCYFRVYTDKNANEVQSYLDVLAREWELYNQQRAIAGRPLNFVYFGGGTPSFISTRQLESLVSRMDAVSSWRSAEEITFECEPGTLTESKLAAIRNVGVTRLSLGIENFDDAILEANGRAHRSPEIGKAYEYARSLNFPQINIDLIAGMLGETDKNWESCVEQTIAMAPDSVTIYQMELPFNTTISKNLLTGGNGGSEGPGGPGESVANWSTKRRWVKEAFQALEAAGYIVGSAYTAVKNSSTKFIYRDRLWQGADMVGLGVASFGYVNGVNVQNLDSFEAYCEEIEAGRIPLARALRPTDEEKLIREFVLQLKLGSIRPAYFENKYGVDPLARFQPQLDALAGEGVLTANRDRVTLSREGLLRVDSLLPRFFKPEHTAVRYT
jgi:oxygen-independent coproporphyrinogen-3 oxidase